MQLYFRGVTYDYDEYYSFKSKTVLESVPQSVQVLHYRGVLYIQERRLQARRTGNEVAYSPKDITQSNVGQEDCAMHQQRMGCLYKLYCIGWKNGSLQYLSFLQHWLFSIFFYYRTGYTEGLKWKRLHCFENQRSKE